MAALAASFLVSFPAATEAADAELDTDEPPITADGLLADVLGSFPTTPLAIHGEMIVRKRRGVELSRVTFNMVVDWGAEPVRLRCRIPDEDGDVRHDVSMLLRAGERPEIIVTTGDKVSLDRTIAATDLTWADLSLSFLWWRGGRIVGTDRTKGRDCYLVDVPAPAWGAALTGYSRVRLWIDQSLHMLLRADGFDGEDQPVRSLWVRSLKKTDDRWMIKDMEVQRYPTAHRTRLHIDSVETLSVGSSGEVSASARHAIRDRRGVFLDSRGGRTPS